MSYQIESVESLSHHRLVALYLIASLLYYKCDYSLLSDPEFDAICKRMKDEWRKIKHPHKRYIKKASLDAGTGYDIKKYPPIVYGAAYQIVAELEDEQTALETIQKAQMYR